MNLKGINNSKMRQKHSHSTLVTAARIYLLDKKGLTGREIAAQLGVCDTTVYDYLADIERVKFMIKEKDNDNQ